MLPVFSRRPLGRNDCVTNEPQRMSAGRLLYLPSAEGTSSAKSRMVLPRELIKEALTEFTMVQQVPT